MIRELLPYPLKHRVRKLLGRERRCHFYDISQIRRTKDTPRTSVIQFYSSVGNIGNYTPVLGIQQMLGFKPDTWCMHKYPVDFDFINKRYSAVIVGGAGLLHRCFNPFFQALARDCKLPIVIWGVGGCFPDVDNDHGVDRSLVRQVASRCDLIDLRDRFTAEFYDLRAAHIGLCPTVVWLEGFVQRVNRQAQRVLFASHEELTKPEYAAQIKDILDRRARGWFYTDNVQRPHFGLLDILLHGYCQSRLVVTTRLHGAIIAYGLGIPYVALARDEKIRAFCRQTEEQCLANNFAGLESRLSLATQIAAARPNPAEIRNTKEFGRKVLEWLPSHAQQPRLR